MVKKMLLVLIAANILGHIAMVDTSSDKDVPGNERTPVMLKTMLGYSCWSVTDVMPAYVMFDNYYWHRIKVINPVSL